MINLTGRHLIQPTDFDVCEMEAVFDLANKIVRNFDEYKNICEGKLLATLFYEPSTRTRFSFEAAMLKLGGSIIGFSGDNTSSAAKGESIKDTIKTVGCYADLAVVRHPKEGSSKVASIAANIPVINGGDGGHMHPTQTLTDLYTILSEKGGFENLKIGLCGDLKFGRTVHSLIGALSRYKGIKFYLISPSELKVPEYARKNIENANGYEYVETESLTDCIGELDVLYMTRVQKERFFNEEDYIRLKDSYILDKKKMKLANEKIIIMHPLPRVNEISEDVDSDKRAVYFKQAKNGMFVRMALIALLLGADKKKGEN